MGIGRKSRKLKGKKRQTGRKIRRGTRRSRFGRMSLMKGGAVPQAGQPQAAQPGGQPEGQPQAAQPGAGAAVEVASVIDGVSTECVSIKNLIDELNKATKNLFEKQAEDANKNKATLTAENDILKQKIEELTNENTQILKKLETDKKEAVEAAQTAVNNLRSELEAAQVDGTAKAEELESIRGQLEAANLELNQEQTEKAAVSKDLEAAKAEAKAAAAASAEAAKEANEKAAAAAAQKRSDENNLRQIRDKINAINAEVEKLRISCIKDIQGSLQNLIRTLSEKKCLNPVEASGFLERLGVSVTPSEQGD